MLKGLLLKITVHQGRTIIPVARAVIPAVRTVIPAARKIMAVLEGGKRGEGGHEQVSSIGNSNYFTRIASYVGAIRGARRDKMYISPFWCGFIAGAVVMFVGIIAWCEWCNRRKK